MHMMNAILMAISISPSLLLRRCPYRVLNFRQLRHSDLERQLQPFLRLFARRALADLALVPHPESASDQDDSRRFRGPAPEHAPARSPPGRSGEDFCFERCGWFLAAQRAF